MGKPLMTQRRGKGGVMMAPSHHFYADTHYRKYDEMEKARIVASVVEFVDDPARSAPLMLLKYEDGEEMALPAAEGVRIGDLLEEGAKAKMEIGSVMPLSQIPEGYPIFNIESLPGDGGSIVRSSGSYAFLIAKEPGKALIKLPSGAMKYFDQQCRATIGCLAGGGRVKKPILKAGVSHYKNLARGHWWPMVRGVHQNVYDHPFGGKQHHGHLCTKKRGGSPGQRVGHIGASRTGRRKR